MAGRIAQRFDAALDEFFIVELHSVRGLVLDAVPQCLELWAVQDGLPRANLAAIIGVLNLKPPSQLAQHV